MNPRRRPFRSITAWFAAGTAAVSLLARADAVLAENFEYLGPANESSFEDVVRRSLDLGNEAILQSGRATWEFGRDEMGWGDPPKDEEVFGVLILLETRLVFVTWDPDDRRYRLAMQLPYSEMIDVRMREFGLARRWFVVETSRHTLHAFFYLAAGSFFNQPRTHNGFNILKERLRHAPDR
jgi:hypothetical protein